MNTSIIPNSTLSPHTPLSPKVGLWKDFSQRGCISDSGETVELVSKGPVAKKGEGILKSSVMY